MPKERTSKHESRWVLQKKANWQLGFSGSMDQRRCY
jgi:hypothetical protein